MGAKVETSETTTSPTTASLTTGTPDLEELVRVGVTDQEVLELVPAVLHPESLPLILHGRPISRILAEARQAERTTRSRHRAPVAETPKMVLMAGWIMKTSLATLRPSRQMHVTVEIVDHVRHAMNPWGHQELTAIREVATLKTVLRRPRTMKRGPRKRVRDLLGMVTSLMDLLLPRAPRSRKNLVMDLIRQRAHRRHGTKVPDLMSPKLRRIRELETTLTQVLRKMVIPIQGIDLTTTDPTLSLSPGWKNILPTRDEVTGNLPRLS